MCFFLTWPLGSLERYRNAAFSWRGGGARARARQQSAGRNIRGIFSPDRWRRGYGSPLQLFRRSPHRVLQTDRAHGVTYTWLYTMLWKGRRMLVAAPLFSQNFPRRPLQSRARRYRSHIKLSPTPSRIGKQPVPPALGVSRI